MFQKNCVDKITTQFLCSITFFENRAVYVVTWKKIL